MQLIKVPNNSKEYKKGLTFQDVEWRKRDKERGFNNPDAQELIFNVLEEEEIIASAKVKIWGSVFQIQSFIVKDKSRGRGVGTYLLNELIAEANSIGCSSLYVSTLSVNKDSIKLYQKHGFIQEGVIKKTFFDNDLVILVKRLK